MASTKPHGGAGKAPIPDVKGLPLESVPFSSSSTLIRKAVKPGASAAAAAAAAAAAPIDPENAAPFLSSSSFSKPVKSSKVAAAAAAPVLAAAAAAPGAAGNSLVRNDPNVSYSHIINTYKCKAEETDESCRKNKLLVVGLTHIPIVGDGNCLFYSFERFFNIYNLPEQKKTHLQIRREVTEYLKAYSRAFLHTFQVPEEERPTMEAILNSVRTPANREAKNDRVAITNPDYIEALNTLFLESIEENKESGTFASGIGDIMPECLARHYGIEITIYDYTPHGDRGFTINKINPSEVTGRPNRGHIRLERINSNHFNLLIPTMTLERFPRVRVLVDFYTALYQLEVAEESLVEAQGVLELVEGDPQEEAAEALVVARQANVDAVQDLLRGYRIAAEPYLPVRRKRVSVRSPVAVASAVASLMGASASAAPKAVVKAPSFSKAAAASPKAAPKAPSKSAASASPAVAAPKPIERPPSRSVKAGVNLLNNFKLSNNNSNSGSRKKPAAAVVAVAATAATAATGVASKNKGSKSRKLKKANNSNNSNNE